MKRISLDVKARLSDSLGSKVHDTKMKSSGTQQRAIR